MKRKKIFAFVMAQALALSSVTMPVYASENTVMQNTVSEQAEQVIGETTDEIANAASDAESEVAAETDAESEANAESATGSETSAGSDTESETAAETVTESTAQSSAESDTNSPTPATETDTETATDAEILSTIEESLSAQEEILVGRPAAAVTECGDEGTFADALVNINLEHPCTFEGEIIIDQAEGLITDENGEELVGADCYATAALLEEDTETAVQILEENGYENVTRRTG